MDPDLRRGDEYVCRVARCRGDERVCGNDKGGVCLGYYSPLLSRAKRGDPVNKKALRANARRHIITWIATVVRQRFQRCSYSFAMTAGLVTCVFPFAGASVDKSPPPVVQSTPPPPPQQGCWAFIRPMRRIIVILFTLGWWALDHPGTSCHPSAEGNLDRNKTRDSSHILPQRGT